MDTTTTSTGMKPRHTTNGGSEDIMAGIEHTRAQMDETLDRLSERLQPRHLLDDLLDYWHSRRQSGRSGQGKEKMKRAAGHVKESAGEAGRTVVDQVRQHPIPALLIGAGIAWLLTERNRDDDYEIEIYEEDYMGDTDYETEGLADMQSGPGPEAYALPSHYGEEEEHGPGMMGKLKEKGARLKQKGARLKGEAGERWERARARSAERSAALRQQARERSAHLREQARHGYEVGVERFKRTTDDYPLAVGAGFLALGVLAGMLLPSTRKEDEWVGPARDRLVRRSRQAAEEAVERGKHVAQTAAEAAKAQAREQGLTPEALKEKARHVMESARTTAKEEGMTPEAMKAAAQTAATNVKERTAEEAKQQKDEMKHKV